MAEQVSERDTGEEEGRMERKYRMAEWEGGKKEVCVCVCEEKVHGVSRAGSCCSPDMLTTTFNTVTSRLRASAIWRPVTA